MRTLVTTLMLFVLTAGSVTAQSYDAALGLRLGTDWGATGQLRLPMIHKNFVLEGIVQSSLQRKEGTLTLLGKQHQNVLSRRLNIFYGAGVHAGWNNELNDETGQTFNGPVGLTGIIGAEVTVARFNISYDFKPAINVSGGESVLYPQTGVSIRYTLAKRNELWDKKKERERNRNRKDRQREKRKDERRKERKASGKRWYEVWKG